MLKILKMDLYRILKMKSTWILSSISLAFSAFSVFILKDTVKNVSDISVFSCFSFFIQCMILLILLPIFAALFTDGDNKTGFIKTIGGIVPNRGILAASKIISCIIYTLGIMLISFLGCCVFSGILLGQIKFDDFDDNYKFIFSQVFTHCSLSVIVSMLAIWWRSGAASMAVGIVFTSGIPSLIFMGLNHLLHKYLSVPKSFDINKYFFVSYLGTEGTSIKTGVIVCAVYFVIAAVAAILIMSKRDVK
ncbi:MAG: ABC transporter permease [Hominimerdicola sp.]